MYGKSLDEKAFQTVRPFQLSYCLASKKIERQSEGKRRRCIGSKALGKPLHGERQDIDWSKYVFENRTTLHGQSESFVEVI